MAFKRENLESARRTWVYPALAARVQRSWSLSMFLSTRRLVGQYSQSSLGGWALTVNGKRARNAQSKRIGWIMPLIQRASDGAGPRRDVGPGGGRCRRVGAIEGSARRRCRVGGNGDDRSARRGGDRSTCTARRRGG